MTTETTVLKPKHQKSKFIFDMGNFKIVWGKVSKTPHTLHKGELLNGDKMEIAINTFGEHVYYHGWSSGN
jgi:hypothetical protein